MRPRSPCDRVLIVEDDVELLNALAEALRLEGVEVTHGAQSLQEARQDLANGFRPQAVILDLHLPDERGEGLLDMLRLDPSYANVRVIALSADWLALAHLRGAVDRTLLKPTSLAGVMRTLHEVCARSLD